MLEGIGGYITRFEQQCWQIYYNGNIPPRIIADQIKLFLTQVFVLQGDIVKHLMESSMFPLNFHKFQVYIEWIKAEGEEGLYVYVKIEC